MKHRRPLWQRLCAGDGVYLGSIRLGRFKLIFHCALGIKRGRLIRKGIFKYKRFKPIYVSWGERTQVAWERGFYNVKFLRMEIIPFRAQLFATPHEVWQHWKLLRARRKRVAARHQARKY